MQICLYIYTYQVNHFVHMYSWEVPCLLGSSSIFGTHLSPLIWMYSKLVVKVLEWGWFGSLSYESTYQPWAIKYYSSYGLCGIATRTSYLAGDFLEVVINDYCIYANNIFSVNICKRHSHSSSWNFLVLLINWTGWWNPFFETNPRSPSLLHDCRRQKSKQTATLMEEMFSFIGNQWFNLFFLAVLGRCSTANVFYQTGENQIISKFH